MSESFLNESSRDDDAFFPDENLKPMLDWLEGIIRGLLPGEDFVLSGTQNRKRIRLDLDFKNKEVIGLFMGPKRTVARSVLSLCRFQQLCRHNRYLELHVLKENGEEDIVTDRDVFHKRVKE